MRNSVSDKPYIQWESSNDVEMAFIDQKIKTKTGLRSVLQRGLFATVRPTYNASGLLDAQGGFVVSRQLFDDVVHFATKEEAVLYINSLAALELD